MLTIIANIAIRMVKSQRNQVHNPFSLKRSNLDFKSLVIFYLNIDMVILPLLSMSPPLSLSLFLFLFFSLVLSHLSRSLSLSLSFSGCLYYRDSIVLHTCLLISYSHSIHICLQMHNFQVFNLKE